MLLQSQSVIQFIYSICCLNTLLHKLSLGDARAYYLSTAKNELGVVSAESAAGKDFISGSF
jgi:hypothetical protein